MLIRLLVVLMTVLPFAVPLVTAAVLHARRQKQIHTAYQNVFLPHAPQKENKK